MLSIVPQDWAVEWLRPVPPDYKMVGPILPEPGKPLPADLEVCQGCCHAGHALLQGCVLHLQNVLGMHLGIHGLGRRAWCPVGVDWNDGRAACALRNQQTWTFRFHLSVPFPSSIAEDACLAALQTCTRGRPWQPYLGSCHAR